MKFSYASVALPTLTPAEAIDVLARAGYRGVEWKVGDAPHAMGSSAADFLQQNRCTLPVSVAAAEQIGNRCAEAGLSVVGLGPYLQIGDLEGARLLVEMALAAGAPQIRLQAARFGSVGGRYGPMFDDTVAFLESVEPVMRDASVRLAVEMHQHTIAPSAALAHRLVRRFDPDVIGVIYDAGNLVFEGYEDPRIGLEILGPHLHHVHLKNAAAIKGPEGWQYVWSSLDDGLVDVEGLLDLLRDRGYTGWISLEDLSTTRDPEATAEYNVRVLQRIPSAEWAQEPGPI